MSFREQLGEAVIPVRASLDGLDADLGRARGQVEQKLNQVGRSLEQTGRKVTRNVTLPVLGAAGAVLKLGGDFETGMNRVQALSGATGTEFEQLSAQAKELGASTQFSARQAADAMGFLAMAGFDANEVYGAMPSVLQLAASAQMDLAQAADIASNILTGFGLEVHELAHANDVLVKAMTSANTDLSQLGQAFKYAGPVAKGAGLTFEETAAALALMGNAGIQGSMAGTSLRGAMVRLLNPTDQVAETLERLGLELTNADGTVKPMVDIIDQLANSSATTGDMMAIFGQRAGPAMAALVSQGSGALAELTDELVNSGGTAKRIAETQMRGWNGAMLAFRSALEAVAIAVAESGVLEFFTGMAQRATSLLQSLAGTNPKIMGTATALLLVAAASGPAIWGLGKLLQMYSPLVAGGTRVVNMFQRMQVQMQLGRMEGLTTAQALRSMVNPAWLAVGVAIAGVAAAVWLHNRRQEELRRSYATSTEAAEGLAESLDLQIRGFAAVGDAAEEAAEDTEFAFAQANEAAIRHLRSLEREAQGDFLLGIGWELVNRGATPEEAFEAIQRLADAAGITVPIELGEVDLGDIDTKLQSVETAFGAIAGSTGDRWRAARREAEDLARVAADLLAADRIDDAVALLASGERQIRDLGLSSQLTRDTVNRMVDDFLKFTEVSGLSIDNAGDLTDVFRELTSGASGLSPVLQQQFRDLELTAEALGGMTLENLAAAAAMSEFDRLVAQGVDPHLANLATRQRDAGRAAEEHATGVDLLDGFLEEVEEQTEETTSALQALNDMYKAMFDPVFGMRDALGKHAEAQEAVNAALAEHGPQSQEASDAQWDLIEATLGLQSASNNLVDAIENGTLTWERAETILANWADQGLITEQQAADLMDQLGLLALRADDLDGRNIDMNVTVHSAEALAAIDQINDALKGTGMTYDDITREWGTWAGGRAAGGPVVAGRAYLVGEEGPELFMPSSSGHILSHPDTAAALSPRGGGGESFTYAPNVELKLVQPPGEDTGRSVGRALRRDAFLRFGHG